MNPLLLHGTLVAYIYEIDRLNTRCGFNFGRKDQRTRGAQKMSGGFLSEVKRLVLGQQPEIVGSRLYATIDLDRARVGRTRVIENEPSNPQWNESFRIYCAHVVSNVTFTIKNENTVGATLIGRASLPVEEIIKGYSVDRWIEILDKNKHPVHGNSKIHVKLEFLDASQDIFWSQGIKSPEFEGVPCTFFKQRQDCKVTLYQDAHVPDGAIHKFILADGKEHEAHRCWVGIFNAISDAKHLIYIAGWSIYSKITLTRDPAVIPPGENPTLGDLLKKKAEDGVRVLILLWDDRTSHEVVKKDGLMATHDQETMEYFRNSKVRCFLCPRNPDDGRSMVQGFGISTLFTHHQKTLVVDSEIPGEGSQKRRIVSFIGGIDLCNGRYDTPDHPLFSTLNTTHRYDFHQPSFPGSSIRKGGPREPWHDIHCRLEGPIAWDVLYNFEQRWWKQVGDEKFIFSLSELDEFIIPPTGIRSSQDPETWNVQLFRSIDGGAAAFGFPKESNEVVEAAEIGLITGKDNVIDRGIQDAYINAIRRAKNFIYIENQYFLGSSYGWKSNDNIKVEDIGALHLIPKELSLKIASKIKAGERFTVYIVIPMWPEGVPESDSVQAILDWQRRTMEMMYTDVAHALQTKRINANLRDYLTFFCLGNRTAEKPEEYVPPERPEPYTDYARAQQARRFMIYVHSKMMIVDDEYIIVGSANVNQRSMDGARDTEIAMGSYQPHHLATSQPAKGQIYGFRMALWHEHLRNAEDWTEHLQKVDDTFLHPESLECVQKVNDIADKNWLLYTSNTIEGDLPGHLLRYPIAVSSNGEITTLPGFEFFPDTKASILGRKSGLLPPILTT